MNQQIPQISVLMPVFNTERYLKAAIDSVLNQTFRDLELVIINDGSTDGSEEIILSYTDPRIKYHKNLHNIGIVDARNKGIDLCKGCYIAMLDSDDIALPERLQKQWDLLNANPLFVMVGADMEGISSNNRYISRINNYCPSHLIKTQLFFNNTFAQSTILIRSNVIKEFRYSTEYRYYAEDYFLWSQIVFKYAVANMSEVLVKYRIHSQSTSIKTSETSEQRHTIMKIHAFHLNKLGITPSVDELNIHYLLLYKYKYIAIGNKKERVSIKAWIEKLIKQNEILQVYDTVFFAMQLRSLWCLKRQLHILYSKRKKKYRTQNNII